MHDRRNVLRGGHHAGDFADFVEKFAAFNERRNALFQVDHVRIMSGSQSLRDRHVGISIHAMKICSHHYMRSVFCAIA